MRILFYCDTVFSFGGVQRVLAEIAKALSGKHDTDYGYLYGLVDVRICRKYRAV